MSVLIRNIQCTGCDYTTSDARRPIELVYQLANGEKIKTGRRSGWCYDCDAFVDIEKLDGDLVRRTFLEVEQQHRLSESRFAKLNGSIFAMFLKRGERKQLQTELDFLGTELTKLKSMEHIANQRKSGPRCLQCRSAKTTLVLFADDGLTHEFRHGCGGQLRASEHHNGLRLNVSMTTYFFAGNGDFLGERTE